MCPVGRESLVKRQPQNRLSISAAMDLPREVEPGEINHIYHFYNKADIAKHLKIRQMCPISNPADFAISTTHSLYLCLPSEIRSLFHRGLPNEMLSLFHRGEAYFIGAHPISLVRNLWIKNLLTNEKDLPNSIIEISEEFLSQRIEYSIIENRQPISKEVDKWNGYKTFWLQYSISVTRSGKALSP